MDQDKKPAAKDTQTMPLAAAPVPPPVRARSFPSRETRLAAVAALFFLMMAGGVLAMKKFLPAANVEPAPAPQEVAKTPSVPEAIERLAPQQPATQPPAIRQPEPDAAFKPVPPSMPPHDETSMPLLEIPPPMNPTLPLPATTKLEQAPSPQNTFIAPPDKVSVPPVLPPDVSKVPIPLPPVLPADVSKIVPVPLPTNVVDSSKPQAKNPVIQLGNNEPPPPEAPPVVVPPMPTGESPNAGAPKIKNNDPKFIAPLKKNDAPKVETPMPKIDAPKSDDMPLIKIDAPKDDTSRVKKEDLPAIPSPPSNLDNPHFAPVGKPNVPPTVLMPPAEPPVQFEIKPTPPAAPMRTALEGRPTEIQPEIKPIPPATIDIAPKSTDIPPVDTQPKAPVKKDGEYDEDMHSLKQNESYRSLSKQYYNSEAYSIALQRYNRDHPGQADYVRIPPIWVLEKQYANDISGAQTARPVNYTAPVVADATPRNEPVYTVSENGEMMADIARKQLGSEDGWKRIWDLNPDVVPAKLIPGGTRLRMPGR